MDYLTLLSLLGIGGAHPGGILLTKAIFEIEQFPLDLSILDAGCGTGQTASYLDQLGYHVIGLDQDQQMINHAKQRNDIYQLDIPYMNESLTKTSISNDTFDIILCESVLNFTSLQQTLPEITRLLKPNGILIAIEMIQKTPLTQNEEKELKDFYGCEHIFTIDDWKDQFSLNDLTVFKVMSQEDYTIEDINEPTTEFSPVASVPSYAFTLLSKHEELTIKYNDKLSYRIFFARNHKMNQDVV